MLIRNATLLSGRRTDIRLSAGHIAAIGANIPAMPQETIFHADGGAVIPGLHDHHIHLLALAASFASFDCGTAHDVSSLARGLRNAAAGKQRLRAINYHDHIAGPIDLAWLDAIVPDIPVRVQHRSGRLWICNSAAIAELAQPGEATPFEHLGRACTGRLYDHDDWLRQRHPAGPPDLAPVGAALARCGVTGVTDATPANNRASYRLLAQAQARGALTQHIAVMGSADILGTPSLADLFPLAVKLHLHESDYPAPDEFLRLAHQAKRHGLGLAVHCVTAPDLIYAVSMLEESGTAAQARIEHASVVPPDMLSRLAMAGITVITQPNFVAERGDAYIADIPAQQHATLYRCASLRRAGIKLGGGTDAPFGHYDPWAAMAAATHRRTRAGKSLGGTEILSPEDALALFTTPARAPGGPPRRIAAGQPADLCILRQPWCTARKNLAAVTVEATMRGEEITYTNSARQTGQRSVA